MAGCAFSLTHPQCSGLTPITELLTLPSDPWGCLFSLFLNSEFLEGKYFPPSVNRPEPCTYHRQASFLDSFYLSAVTEIVFCTVTRDFYLSISSKIRYKMCLTQLLYFITITPPYSVSVRSLASKFLDEATDVFITFLHQRYKKTKKTSDIQKKKKKKDFVFWSTWGNCYTTLAFNVNFVCFRVSFFFSQKWFLETKSWSSFNLGLTTFQMNCHFCFIIKKWNRALFQLFSPTCH